MRVGLGDVDTALSTDPFSQLADFMGQKPVMGIPLWGILLGGWLLAAHGSELWHRHKRRNRK